MRKLPPFDPNLSETHRAILERIAAKVDKIRNYTPKVGIFGVTGVGKSSLCNALFGRDAAAVSDVAACTRKPQEFFIGNTLGKGIKLVDVPGVGENQERDREYFELYKNLLPELDLVLWVIKADDRAYTIAEKAYKEILKPDAARCPTVFVINQVDKLPPLRDWDDENNRPGSLKQNNIDKKIFEISKAFDVSAHYIAAVSAEEKYNLVNLMNTIVEVLPNEKKYSVTREAKEEVKNEAIEEKAERGIWESVKEIAGEAWDFVKDAAVGIVVSGAKSAAKFIKSFFSWR